MNRLSVPGTSLATAAALACAARDATLELGEMLTRWGAPWMHRC